MRYVNYEILRCRMIGVYCLVCVVKNYIAIITSRIIPFQNNN